MASWLRTLRHVVEPTTFVRAPTATIARGDVLRGGGGDPPIFKFSESRWYLVMMALGLFVMLSVLTGMVLSSGPKDRDAIRATAYVAAGTLAAAVALSGFVLMEARASASTEEAATVS